MDKWTVPNNDGTYTLYDNYGNVTNAKASAAAARAWAASMDRRSR